MAAKEQPNYWTISALIAGGDSESSMTMASFIAYVEKKCPKADGWKVVHRETTPLEQNIAGVKQYLPYLTYHLERE